MCICCMPFIFAVLDGRRSVNQCQFRNNYIIPSDTGFEILETNLGPFNGCRLPGTLKDIATSVQRYWSFATHMPL